MGGTVVRRESSRAARRIVVRVILEIFPLGNLYICKSIKIELYINIVSRVILSTIRFLNGLTKIQAVIQVHGWLIYSLRENSIVDKWCV